MAQAEVVMKETMAKRLRALEELKSKVPADVFDEFMHEQEFHRAQEIFFNSNQERSRTHKPMRKTLKFEKVHNVEQLCVLLLQTQEKIVQSQNLVFLPRFSPLRLICFICFRR